MSCVLSKGIDDHVAGAGVEGCDVLGCRVRRDDGDIGNAADIEGDAAAGGVAEEKVVDEGDEGRALAAESNIGGAKVGDGEDASAGGDDGGFGDLEGGGEFGDGDFAVGGKSFALPLVEDGLTVGADGGDLIWFRAGFFKEGEGGTGEEFAEEEVEMRDLAGGGRGFGGEFEDELTDLGRVGGGVEIF